jgi:hypothetical protein
MPLHALFYCSHSLASTSGASFELSLIECITKYEDVKDDRSVQIVPLLEKVRPIMK